MAEWAAVGVAVVGVAVSALVAWVITLRSDAMTEQHHDDDSKFARSRVAAADNQRALTVLGEITSLQVQEARHRLAFENHAPSRAFIIDLVSRANVELSLLTKTRNLNQDVNKLLYKKIRELHKLAPKETQDAVDQVEAKLDRSRYSWMNSGSFTKHQIVQKIAQRYAEQHQSRDLKGFLDGFGPEVRGAVDRPGDTFRPELLLIPLDEAKDDHRRVADSAGALLLGGRKYVVRHSMGYPAKDYAQQTQVPFIRSAVQLGYPVKSLA